MTQHTALFDLGDQLRLAGLNVIDLPGWDTAQGNYLWTDPDSGQQGYDRPPSGYMVHHTAGSVARPVVKDSNGKWSVANAWIGLTDDGGQTLTQDGPGDPMIVLVAAGPARISSGYGFRPAAWDHTFRDLRAPTHAMGGDSSPQIALNRYVFNVEVTHRGDGSRIDDLVWGHTVAMGVVLHEMFGWDERTLGHTSWTRRKIDPKWSVGAPNDGADSIIDVQDAIAGILTIPPIDPPPIDPPDPIDRIFPIISEGDGFLNGDRPETRPAVKALQAMLTHWEIPTTIDGAFGPDTTQAVRSYQSGHPALTVDGIVADETWAALNGRPW